MFTRRGWVCATLSISLTRSVSSSGALAIGYVGTNWELDFKQCSFHHIMQVLRVCNFCAFSLPPAFPPCSCPLTFRHQVRWVTYRISSESYPGNQECVATCHGAEECTCVHHTIHPAPSPPYAGRYTVPSRFGCQSGDCGYRVRRLCTGRYLPAPLRRILLMEQQVWSIQLADNQPCDLVSQLPLNSGESVKCGSGVPSSIMLFPSTLSNSHHTEPVPTATKSDKWSEAGSS